MSRRSVAVLLVALALAGCGTTVVNPVSGRAERTVMDERTEIEEGRKAHEQVLAEYGAVKDDRLQAYVDELGQKLARQSHRAGLQWHFTVLDSPEVNAFALPGGYVYVTRGIMAYMDSEADLAGVIGHEIGHVTARHGAQRATREQRAGIGVFAATVLGVLLEAGGVSGAGQMMGELSQGVAAGWVASHSREQELQADRLGAEYLARSRYDPRNMIDVIGVLKAQEHFLADRARAEGRPPPAGGGWLATHPSNDQRLQQITAAAATYTGGHDDDGRERYRRAIEGLTFGDSREQGVVRGRHFYHELLGLSVTAPAGWELRNGADALVVANPAGDAAMVMKTVPAEAGASHDEVAQKVFKPVALRSERFSLNGLAATRLSGERADDQGRRQPFEATLVDTPDRRRYALLFVGRDAAALQRARAGLREAEASFRPLNLSDRSVARPWVVRSVPLPAGGLAELARRSPLGAAGEGQLKLLNGVYDGGELRAGQRVKTIE